MLFTFWVSFTKNMKKKFEKNLRKNVIIFLDQITLQKRRDGFSPDRMCWPKYHDTVPLKRDIQHYLSKSFTWPHMNMQKWSTLSCWLRPHDVSGHDVSIDVEYADTSSLYLLVYATRTRCQQSRWLGGHFRKSLKASHRFLRNNQAKRYLGDINNLKIWKPTYLK